MSVILRFKTLSNGYVSPYFEINYNGERNYEFHKKLKFKEPPKNLAERLDRKSKLQILNQLKGERENEILRGNYESTVKVNSKQDFFEYLQHYIDTYPNEGDRRAYTSMQKHLKLFTGKSKLSAFEVTEVFAVKFNRHLIDRLNYETPATYFKKFKKVCKQATKDGLFKVNPTTEVQIRKFDSQEKDILTVEEIKVLMNTHCGNQEVKKAFTFACYTGLRWVDCVRIKWKNIKGGLLIFQQSKTKVPMKQPLHETALAIIGVPGKSEEPVFNLPSHTGMLKSLRAWTKKAEIDKHITFHCGRHSLGTNLCKLGVNDRIIQILLGHTTLKYTARYVHVAEEQKVNAINKL